jgi:hypothetical protein
MSEPQDEPTLDDVIEPTEQAPRDRSFHGKQPPHLNDDELERRTEHERAEVGLTDYDPTEVPPATD